MEKSTDFMKPQYSYTNQATHVCNGGVIVGRAGGWGGGVPVISLQ